MYDYLLLQSKNEENSAQRLLDERNGVFRGMARSAKKDERYADAFRDTVTKIRNDLNEDYVTLPSPLMFRKSLLSVFKTAASNRTQILANNAAKYLLTETIENVLDFLTAHPGEVIGHGARDSRTKLLFKLEEAMPFTQAVIAQHKWPAIVQRGTYGAIAHVLHSEKELRPDQSTTKLMAEYSEQKNFDIETARALVASFREMAPQFAQHCVIQAATAQMPMYPVREPIPNFIRRFN